MSAKQVELGKAKNPVSQLGAGSVSVGRDELLKALRPLLAIVPRRTSLPITMGIWMEAKDRGLRLRATNLDTMVETSCLADVTKPFGALINARYWYALLQGTPAGSALNVIREDGVLKLDTPSLIEAEMKWEDPEDFPRTPDFKPGSKAVYCGSEFRKSLPRLFHAAATDDSRPVLTGAFVDGERGVWATTDGFRLTAMNIAPLEGDLGAIGPIMCAEALLQAARYATDDEYVSVEINETRTQTRIITGGITWQQSVVQGTFPNYNGLIPSEWTTRVTLNPVALTQALKLLAPVARDGSGIIRLEASKAGVKLWTKAEDLGTARVSMLSPVEGEDGCIALNHHYLIQAAALFDGDFTMEFRKPSDPCALRPLLGGENLTHLIMPMFVQW